MDEQEEFETFRLLIEAARIPMGSIVTKRTGSKEYILRDKIRIFGEQGEPKEVKASEGALFLVNDGGDLNVIGSSTLLLWHTDRWELTDWLNLESQQ
jgi:hypothetical protein